MVTNRILTRSKLAHRVDALQQMLTQAVPVDQQILMHEGRRLDAQQPLSTYGLPAVRQRWLYA